MRNIPYDDRYGLTLPQTVQIQRVRRVMEEELTARQKQVLEWYYFEELRPAEIARRLGVHRSTAMRTLRRAEANLRRYLTH